MHTSSAVPQNHYAFPPLTGSTNPADPRGWLYAIVTADVPMLEGAQNLSSLFAPATISSVRQHCPYPKCYRVSSALGATAVNMVGALLDTSTVHVTGTFSTSASPAATAKQSQETARTSEEEQGSVLKDPVAAPTPTPTNPTKVADISDNANEAAVTVSSEGKLIGSTASAADTTTASPDSVADTRVPLDSLNPATLAAATVTPASDLLGETVASGVAMVQPTSKLLEETGAAPPAETTQSTENIGVAIVQLLTSALADPVSNGKSTPTPTDAGEVLSAAETTSLTATKQGATGVTAATQLLTIDSNFNVITPTAEVTQAAAKLSDSLPEPSTQNGDDVLSAAMTTDRPKSLEGATGVPAVSELLRLGSDSVVAQETQVATTISGVSTDVPAIVLGSQTIPVGASGSVGSVPVAVITAGGETAIVVDGSTRLLPQGTVAQEVASQPPIIIGSSTITANSDSQYIVAGQTLAPRSSITIGGTPIALQTDGPEGNVLVVGTSSSVLQLPSAAATEAGIPLVVGSSTITANSASEYVVAGQTLKPGSSITVGSGSSTSVIALETHGSETILVIGTSSSVLQQAQPTAVLIVGAAKFTPTANSEYIIGSQILLPGASAITVSGVKYSLAPDGGQLVAGSSTQILTSESGLGGLIWSALDGTSSEERSKTDGKTATTTHAGSSSVSAISEQATATSSQEAAAAEMARPVCLWGVVAALVTLWVMGEM